MTQYIDGSSAINYDEKRCITNAEQFPERFYGSPQQLGLRRLWLIEWQTYQWNLVYNQASDTITATRHIIDYEHFDEDQVTRTDGMSFSVRLLRQ